mmetsp:Transcript_1776/g.1882  ORF Transcript_1776/g.1882 Transcript_1776/m.1882 type:complete len:248 (+) Transcript_1776:547-1290(+)
MVPGLLPVIVLALAIPIASIAIGAFATVPIVIATILAAFVVILTFSVLATFVTIIEILAFVTSRMILALATKVATFRLSLGEICALVSTSCDLSSICALEVAAIFALIFALTSRVSLPDLQNLVSKLSYGLFNLRLVLQRHECITPVALCRSLDPDIVNFNSFVSKHRSNVLLSHPFRNASDPEVMYFCTVRSCTFALRSCIRLICCRFGIRTTPPVRSAISWGSWLRMPLAIGFSSSVAAVSRAWA